MSEWACSFDDTAPTTMLRRHSNCKRSITYIHMYQISNLLAKKTSEKPYIASIVVNEDVD